MHTEKTHIATVDEARLVEELVVLLEHAVLVRVCPVLRRLDERLALVDLQEARSNVLGARQP